jgi:glycine/D-amino acid oxidase-like deaminating enzyme
MPPLKGIRRAVVTEGDVMGERKVVIVGAGQISATFAFALMINGIATSIVVIDYSGSGNSLCSSLRGLSQVGCRCSRGSRPIVQRVSISFNAAMWYVTP